MMTIWFRSKTTSKSATKLLRVAQWHLLVGLQHGARHGIRCAAAPAANQSRSFERPQQSRWYHWQCKHLQSGAVNVYFPGGCTGAAACITWRCMDACCREEQKEEKKNNTADSNVVPHRSTNAARTCLTSLSGREAVLSDWFDRSYYWPDLSNISLSSFIFLLAEFYCQNINSKYILSWCKFHAEFVSAI